MLVEVVTTGDTTRRRQATEGRKGQERGLGGHNV